MVGLLSALDGLRGAILYQAIGPYGPRWLLMTKLDQLFKGVNGYLRDWKSNDRGRGLRSSLPAGLVDPRNQVRLASPRAAFERREEGDEMNEGWFYPQPNWKAHYFVHTEAKWLKYGYFPSLCGFAIGDVPWPAFFYGRPDNHPDNCGNCQRLLARRVDARERAGEKRNETEEAS